MKSKWNLDYWIIKEQRIIILFLLRKTKIWTRFINIFHVHKTSACKGAISRSKMLNFCNYADNILLFCPPKSHKVLKVSKFITFSIKNRVTCCNKLILILNIWYCGCSQIVYNFMFCYWNDMLLSKDMFLCYMKTFINTWKIWKKFNKKIFHILSDSLNRLQIGTNGFSILHYIVSTFW